MPDAPILDVDEIFGASDVWEIVGSLRQRKDGWVERVKAQIAARGVDAAHVAIVTNNQEDTQLRLVGGSRPQDWSGCWQPDWKKVPRCSTEAMK